MPKLTREDLICISYSLRIVEEKINIIIETSGYFGPSLVNSLRIEQVDKIKSVKKKIDELIEMSGDIPEGQPFLDCGVN